MSDAFFLKNVSEKRSVSFWLVYVLFNFKSKLVDLLSTVYFDVCIFMGNGFFSEMLSM